MSPLSVTKEVESRWNAAASPWDAVALAGLYNDDALFFGLLPEFFVGRSAIEAYFSYYVGLYSGVTLSLVDQEVREISPTIIAAQGFGDIRNTRCDGLVVASRVRTSLVMTRSAQGWGISLHHFSHIPASFPKKPLEVDA
ncbi:YybH family protein [Ancylobacter sp.]|uniref:YybH family protein n=1 Tax=Ancylobacter sp. TaxID=1872567 RepID=UPI003BAA558C